MRGWLTAGVAGLALAAGAAAATAATTTTRSTTTRSTTTRSTTTRSTTTRSTTTRSTATKAKTQAAPTRPRAGPCLVPGVGKPLDAVWRPDMLAAIGYNDTRRGDIAFVVRTPDRLYAYRPDHVEWSASVVKAMLMVAYLDQPWVAGRALNSTDTSLLDPMITQSDDNAGEQVNRIIGKSGLDELATRVGMTHFEAVEPFWGGTHITASDQTKFFLHIDSDVVPRHRAYAMHLLASIVPSERWGIGEVAPKGWQLYFKGGWGYGTGLVDHQVALLVRGCARVSIAVLTMFDGSHAYGKETLEGIFARLLRGLPTGAHPRRHRRPTHARMANRSTQARMANRSTHARMANRRTQARMASRGHRPTVSRRPAPQVAHR